jgi:drug/metabolite transporter (DMT)-like permease
LALAAFAANSVLCRLALGEQEIGAVGFTAFRLVSGAVALWVIGLVRRGSGKMPRGGSWTSGAMLFLYALAFSLAYLELSTGTGALILFGTVQLTMLLWGRIQGERPRFLQWIGMAVASMGLVVLVLPGLATPSPRGAAWMALAGFAWGVYSLRGKGVSDPVAATADNFLRAAPLVLAVLALAGKPQFTAHGIFWAVLSGAVTSGLGYVAWYAALRGLTATRAALIQLAVPVLAALGGILFLSEGATFRLLAAGALTLGGLALVFQSRERMAR